MGYGQTAATYNFSQTAGTYTALGGTATTAYTSTDDAVTGTAVTIPFTFTYAGTGYTSLRISTNGFLTLGNATTPGSGGYTPISATGGAYSTSISALGRDLNSTVKYETLGSSPNRIFVVEWSGAARYVSGLLSENLNFQIRLNETTNVVEIVYGAMTTSHTVLTTGISEVGLKSAPAVYNNVTLTNSALTGYTYTNNWNSLINGSLQADAVPVTSTVKPASGTTLKWTPSSCALVTVSATASAITASSATISWTNSGTYASGYRVRWRKVDEDYTAASWATPTPVAAGSSSYNITGLAIGTYYVYSVEGLCSGTSANNYSTVTTANTTNGKGLFQTSLLACVAPTAQPTVLNLTSVTATTLSGSFTAASPAASGYLVVRSTSSTLSATPSDTNTYVAGATLGGGTVVQSGTATTFTQTGLTANTQYYYFVFSFNNTSCSGGPKYFTAAPLTANTYTCLATPTASAGSSITSSGFTANWAVVTGATGYLLDVSTVNTFASFVAGYNGLVVSGGSTISQAVTGLNPATPYYYRIRATNATACTSANSSTITVVTACAAITVFPSVESFATYLPSTCWIEGDAGVSLATGPATTGATVSDWGSDDYLNATTPVNLSAKMNIDAATGYEWIISPQYTIPANDYQVKYNVGATQFAATTAPTTAWEADDFVELLVSTTGTTNWTVLKTYNSSSVPSNLGQLDATTLAAYSGQTVRFAFRAFEGASNGSADIDFFIDNFTVEQIPSCLPPTALTTTALVATTATFSWSAPAVVPASYDIYYGTGSVATPLAVPNAGTVATSTSTTTNSAIIGLTANTSYQYYVRSACGGANGNSTWAGPYTFVTQCGSTNVTYTQDFESVTVPAIPSCTSIQNAGTGNDWKTSANPGFGNTTKVLTYQFNSTNAANAWFYSQGLNLINGTSYRLIFKYNASGTTFTEKLKVAYGTSATSGSMTNVLYTNTAINQTAAFQSVTVDFTPTSTGVFYIGFNAFSAIDQAFLYVDDISVTLSPTDAVDYANIQSPGVSTTTTGTSVDIYGQAYEPGVTDPAGAATGLLVWYSTNATDVDPSSAGWTGTWTAATFNTNVGNNDEWKGTINPIIGQANTYYSFRYQLNGGPYRYGGYPSGFWNGTSQKNGKLSVNYEVYTNSTPKTINDVITINFKDFDASNIFYTGTETTIYAYAGIRIVSGTDFNYAQGNINTLSSLIPFTLSGGIYSSTIKLADYFCIPAGVNVDGVNMIFRNQYFTGGNCDGTFGNNDKTCNLYLDLTNATVAVNPPTAVANNTVTLTSANVTFTAPLKGTNKGYEYYVSTSATTPGAGVTPVVAAASSPVAISGLSNATTYYIYVRTVGCGSDRSAWSAYTSFTTLSPPPANDACSNATALPCATVALAGTTIGSVSEVLSVTAWNASTYGVWYTFVGDGTLNLISTTAGSGFDHKLSIASGSCGALTNVTTVDVATGGGTETYSFTPVLGTVYYVYISYYGSSGTAANTGTFTISRTCNVTPTYCTAHTDYAPEAYIDDVQFIGTLNDVSNLNSSYSNSPSGYQDFTALPKSIQAQGEGVNVYVNGNTQTRIYAWVDWNNDGDFSDSGEQIYDSVAGTSDTTFGFIIPAATPPGNYRIRIRNGVNYYDDNSNGIIDLDDEIFYPSFDSCVDFEETTYFGDDDLYYGEAEDYLFTVIANCFATIATVTDGTRCGPGNVSLTATGSTGTTTYLWYAAQTGGAPLQNSASNTYSPTISATTTFYVTASNGTCESLVRKPVVANMKEVPDVNFSPATPITCGDKNPIMLSAASDNETVYLVNENFEGSGLGLFGNQNIVGNGGTINQISRWERKSSPFIPTDGADVWTPSISSGYGVNKFAFSTSDVGPKTVGPPATYYVIDHGLALTSAVNTQNYTDLTLKFRVYFSRYNINTVAPASEYLAVETSTNGTTWTPVANANYSTDLGTPGNFQQITVNMNSFINIATLQFRIRYYASSWYDGVAVDDIQLYGTKPLVASFTWSGSTDISVYTDALGTIPYVPGSAEDIVYIQPNIALLATPSFNIDVTTQLTNGCTITKTINVTNKSKVWNGSANTAWENANNWSPVGVPSTDDCIIIPSTTVKPIISDVAQGKNLAIKSLGELLVNSDKVLTVQDAVDVNAGGKITFENNASLVQVNENPSINSGNIIYKRNSGNMLRYSYTYWASPVFATAQTLSALSPATLHDKYYSWDSAGQSWTLHDNGTVTMEKAKGYIVRAPQTYPITGTAASYNATFNGVPNNGLITIATQGSTTAEKFNLIGNPYPSALDANLFLASSINPDLEGTIYLWTNFTGVSSVPNAGGNYSYTDSDYATYNFSGGTATAPATGSSVEPTGFVAAGQSFFVKGISNGSGTATFNNTMRIGANNNQFFRNTEIERHRFWLNLENSQGGFNQALIAYVQGATNDYDRGYDGELFGGNTATFYSIIPDKLLTIQGKSLPFDLNDVVPMGYKTTVAGNYKITLDHFDGLFDTQAVYLKDKLLNTIHDIKNAPYSFTSAVGTFDNRFEIVYRQETLGVNNPNFDPNSIVIYKKDKEIFINAGLASISQLRVFDIQGRMIYENKNINKTDAVIKNLPPAEQVLIVQVVLLDGNTVSKKVVY